MTSASTPDISPDDPDPADRFADDPAHCVFCRIAASGPPSADNGVLWRGALTYAVLNAYPYASGHLMVLPIRHLGSLADLKDDESAELWVGVAPGGARPSRPRWAPRASTSVPTWACGGRRHTPAPPSARRAPMAGGHQLHDHGGRHPGAAGGTGRHLGEDPPALAGLTRPLLESRPRTRAFETAIGGIEPGRSGVALRAAPR